MKNKPIILALGETGVGKKTLFKSNHLIEATPFTDVLTCWEQKKLRVIVPHEFSDAQDAQLFFKTFKKYFFLQRIQLVVFFIALPTLIDPDTLLRTQKRIQTQYHLLNQLQKNTAAVIVITQCDRLLGFQEYFSDLTAEERDKTLAIHNENELEQLLASVNATIITRLHQEPLQEKRYRIQLFPAQLEHVLRISAQWLPQATAFYLTSSEQKNDVIDALIHTTSLALPQVTQKTFFANSLFAELSTRAIDCQRRSKRRTGMLLLCACILASAITFWHISFEQASQTINDIQQTLAQTPALEQNEPQWLIQINFLYDAIQKLNQLPLVSLKILGFNQVTMLNQRLQLLYHTRLETQFLPYLEQRLTSALIENAQKNHEKLYSTLAVYLMLTDRTHYDATTIVNWFQSDWQQSYKDQPLLQTYFNQHLLQLLAYNQTNWPRNNQLIHNTRVILNTLKPEEIIFIELQDIYKNRQEPLDVLSNNIAYFGLSPLKIPALFNTSHFNSVYNHDIPTLIHSFNQGNWVIGTPSHTSVVQPTLLDKARAWYVHAFSAAWQNLIVNMTLKKPNNLEDAQNLIESLQDSHSSLMNLLSFMLGNAFLSQDLPPNYELAQLNEYLAKKTVFEELQPELNGLATYLKKIQNSHDPFKASYDASVLLFNNPTAPNPIQNMMTIDLGKNSLLKNWVVGIAQNSFSVLLKNTKLYLDQAWSTIVLPTYIKEIQNRYPLFENSPYDATLLGFSNFFEPNGPIDVFFNYYLKPFVNMSDTYWTWSDLYGQTLPISQDTLELFMRASLIQRMFFMDDAEKASFKFSLSPLSKADTIQSLVITIAGQPLSFSENNTLFLWPASMSNETSIHVIYSNQAPEFHFFNGPWALFRLLKTQTLIPTTNPQQYILQLKLNNATATYRVIMDNKVNPFLPGVLTKFRCPSVL